MEQLTLEQAAETCADRYTFCTPGAIRGAFKKGAQWQKEQYKRLIELASEAANVCEGEGAMVTATNLRNEIERLQD